jgi:sugar phosphate isomerase/epimerase
MATSQTQRQLGPHDLIASHFTLTGAAAPQPPRFSFAQRVAAAAAAGFNGIGLFTGYCESGTSAAQMRRIADDHAIVIAELEWLTDWWCEGDRGRQSRDMEERMYEAADALGSRHLVIAAVAHGEHPDAGAVAERFAELCERADEHDLLVGIEFFPGSEIRDAGAAWDIARYAGANGGVLVDSWHYFRGAANPAHLRAIPAQRIVAIQFDDADQEVIGSLFEDTTLRRRLPGEGSFDLAGFIRLLDEIGVQAPISVEIFSPEHQGLPLAQAARRAHDTSRAVIAKARPGLLRP